MLIIKFDYMRSKLNPDELSQGILTHKNGEFDVYL